MTNVDPETLMRLLGGLGVMGCCGFPLLLFAAITLYSALRHARNSEAMSAARPVTIVSCQVGQLVRLQGRIAEVPQMLDGPAESPLALLQLQVTDVSGSDEGPRMVGNKLRAVPFRLEDGSGSIWVHPQGLDKVSLGPGVPPGSMEIGEAAAIRLGINPAVLHGRVQVKMWELRGGQQVTVIGVVQQTSGEKVVAKAGKQPFVVTGMLGSVVQLQTARQVRTAWIFTALLGIPGLLAILCGGVVMLLAGIELLRGG